MAQPYVSEIRIMAFGDPPDGWASCDGQLLPINQNQALFSLLGNRYGGNGRTTFALPDLRGRVPIHAGSLFALAQRVGTEAHTLTVEEMPAHRHPLRVRAGNGTGSIPAGNLLASANNAYRDPQDLVPMHPDSISTTGGGRPHDNVQPYQALNFCIALRGVFPSPS